MPFIESVTGTEYVIAVNSAPVSLSEPNDSPRPIAGPRRRMHPAAGRVPRGAHRARAAACGGGRARATLLAALSFRARLVLLRALSSVELLRQYGPGRTQLVKPGFQYLDPTPRSLDRPAQPGILLVQPTDRGLLATRPPQDVAQMSGLVERKLRQRCRAESGIRAVSFLFVNRDPSSARRSQQFSSVTARTLAAVSPGILFSLCRLRFSRDSILAVSLMLSARSFSLSGFLWKSPIALFPRPTSLLSRATSVPSASIVATSPDRAPNSERSASRRATCARKEGYVACRAAELLRLLLGLAQPLPAGPEPPFPRTGIATGGHFRPVQFFATRFGHVRPRPLLFMQGLEILRRGRLGRLGRRPNPRAVLDQRRACGEIIVQNRHALDHGAGQIVLPDPL